MGRREKMMLEICEELGIDIERGFTAWQRWGFRLKGGRGHFNPVEKFWSRNYVIEEVHKRICRQK